MSQLTEQQRRAVSSTQAHVLVSAGAGSGKTHVLVERYIEILRNSPRLSATDLIAVTYTKKAAQEMRNRLKARMEELVKSSVSVEEKARWAQLRSEVDSARIGTIHSLCESILKTFPAESRVDPQFQVLDDLEGAELLESSINEALAGLAGNDAGVTELVLSYPVETVKDWVVTLIKSSIQYKEALAAMPGLSDEQLTEHVERLLLSISSSRVEEVLADCRWEEALAFLEETHLPEGNNLEPQRREVLERAREAERMRDDLRQCVTCLKNAAAVINLKVGKKDELSRQVKQALRTLRSAIRDRLDDLPEQVNDEDRKAFSHIRALVSLTQAALEKYEHGKNAAQKLDFNDLIRRTHELLSGAGSVARSYFNEHIAAILVDEFQDTNTMQAGILALLAGTDTRLFLIGDDKQSIYKFQGADVATFNQWKRHFQGGSDPEQTDGRPPGLSGDFALESLDRSFRSHPGIVGFVNAVFEKLLASGDAAVPSYEACHQALEPHRQDAGDEPRVEVVVFDAADENGKTDSRRSKALEASAVAAWIQEKIAKGAPVLEKSGVSRAIDYGDFAILVQRNDDLEAFEKELARAGIPYVAMGGAGFLDRQEVYDIENLLRFLDCPQDSHALLGALRSPMFGLTDDLINGLAGQGTESLWSALEREASGQGAHASLRQVTATLKLLAETARRSSLPDLVRSIVRTTSYDLVLMGLPNGRQRSRNLWKLVSMAEERAHLSVGAFADCLEEMRNLSVKQTAAPVDSGNSVKLMTIHAAKGLEFPAVIIPVMGVDAARLSGKLRMHRDYGIALDSTRDARQEKPSLFRLAGCIETSMATAEKKRLFYVAMTRARDYLVMLVDRNGRDVPSFKRWLKETLLPSGDGDLEPGRMRLAGRTGCGDYQVSVFGLDLLSALQVKAVPEGQLDGGDLEDMPVPAYDLVEPVPSARIEPAESWQALLRVTPAAGQQAVEPAVAGRFFHAVMERICRNPEAFDQRTLEDVARSQAIGVVHRKLVDALVAEGKDLVARFFDSPLCRLIKESQVLFSEPPYLVVAGERGVAAKRPDLLLKDAEGQWHVIDFKTDHFELAELHARLRAHSRQLEDYAADIKALAGVDARKFIYFAQHGLLCELEAAPPAQPGRPARIYPEESASGDSQRRSL
ncbi:MAG TPA: UvrD-helicase domain-containing protein [Candidatus Obscuribacterales bacterium]